MAKKKVLDHVHKLKRVKYTNDETVFFCTKGACEYTINTKLALGKPSECWRCGKEFNLNEISIRLTKPHCIACTKVKGTGEKRNERTVSPTISPAEDLRKRLLGSIPQTLAGKTEDDEQIFDSDNDLL